MYSKQCTVNEWMGHSFCSDAQRYMYASHDMKTPSTDAPLNLCELNRDGKRWKYTYCYLHV